MDTYTRWGWNRGVGGGPGEPGTGGHTAQRPDVGTAASAINLYKGEFYKQRFRVTGYYLILRSKISSPVPFMTKYVKLAPNER